MVDVGESGTRKARPPVPELVDELFKDVEESQGHGFWSDGECAGFTHQQFFERVRGRLDWNLRAVAIIRKFLRKYGEQ